MTDSSQQNSADDLGVALADLLCLPVAGKPAESRRGPLSNRVVKGAAALVDDSGLVEQWEQWYRDDHPDWATRGGRPGTVNIRPVLVALVALAVSGAPPLASRVAEALDKQLHTPARDLLGLPRAREHVSEDAFYHRVYRRIRWLLNLIEPYPTPGRRVTRTERETMLTSLDPQTVAVRVKRVQHVTNTVLEASARLVPDDVRARWNGNVCVDATLIRTWGKRGHPKPKPGKDNSADKMSPETVAGWYVRENPDTGKKEMYFGYEAHLAVMAASDPGKPAEFPLLVLAMSVDKPGQNVGGNAATLLTSLQDCGYPAGTLAGDRAYFPNPQPEHLQLPARALGYTLCGDYRDDQLGIQAEYGGAILVEGNWYCPSMPQPLVDASINHRARTITDEVYEQRIAQRARYAFRPKHAPTPDGNTAWMCPARGPGATATCPLAADNNGPVNLGLPTTRTRIINPPTEPDICCTNSTSITIPVAPRRAGNSNIAKYFQDLRYKSPEWQSVYATLRNTIEGFNGFTKSPTEENTEEPARRRIRGYAFQALAAAVLILASNVRKIDAWLNRRNEQPAPEPTSPRRRRNTRPDLADYLPPADGPPLAQPA
ncbi:MAG: hypothetical protein R2720_02950 [Candidatus Nanopelagicales bacterium]